MEHSRSIIIVLILLWLDWEIVFSGLELYENECWDLKKIGKFWRVVCWFDVILNRFIWDVFNNKLIYFGLDLESYEEVELHKLFFSWIIAMNGRVCACECIVKRWKTLLPPFKSWLIPTSLSSSPRRHHRRGGLMEWLRMTTCDIFPIAWSKN